MSFQQGVSGLNATSKNLEIIGHNIANANTYGTKVSRGEFADVYATALGRGGTSPIGIGVNLQAVAQQFTQGNISTTENPLDLAIKGSGFFQVQESNSTIAYTRNGQFKIDRDGFIVNNARGRLVGYAADANGVIQPGAAVPLQLPTGNIAPAPTTTVQMELNLDARQAVTTPAAGPQVVFGEPRTYNNATSLTVYDAKGQDVSLTYYFQKAGTDTWNVYATANGTTVGGTPGDPQPVTQLTFPSNGRTPTAPLGPITFDIPASTNANGAAIEPITGVTMDFARVTQYGSGFGVTDLGQDGFAAGLITEVTMDATGIIMAYYSNGQTKPAGQIEIATFRNPQGLLPQGDNAWMRSYASGEPVVGVPGDGNLGILQAGALEESNIDLTQELVNMITAQRSYQANAQTIKTMDQVLQTLVNIR